MLLYFSHFKRGNKYKIRVEMNNEYPNKTTMTNTDTEKLCHISYADA